MLDYSIVALVIVAVAVIVKIVLGRYVRHAGKTVNSDSLINSGEDATLDSVISASTLVAVAIYLLFHISLEAWLGAVIAAVIIKSGLGMLSETLCKILGERADAQLARDTKQTINSYPEVSGAYDLVLHNYGPDSHNGSVISKSRPPCLPMIWTSPSGKSRSMCTRSTTLFSALTRKISGRYIRRYEKRCRRSTQNTRYRCRWIRISVKKSDHKRKDVKIWKSKL